MITSHLNDYYEKFITAMIRQIEVSTPGKRAWTMDHLGNCDYSPTTRSTFPDWSKFFYVTTSRSHKTGSIPYEDGYFNGNTKELLRMLNTAKIGRAPKTDRLRAAFDIAISGFYEYMYEFEMEYGEAYL